MSVSVSVVCCQVEVSNINDLIQTASSLHFSVTISA
jgi:hypothetical protein